jgi:hypothetical protein
MTLPTGYYIADRARDLLARLADGAEDEAELDALLAEEAALHETATAKLGAYHAIIRRAEVEAELAKATADQWAALARRHAAVKERVRNRALALAEAVWALTGEKRWRLDDGTSVSFTTAAQSLRIEDETQIPAGFMEFVEQPKRSDIKAALKAGETVPGCALIAGKVSLAFRVAR